MIAGRSEPRSCDGAGALHPNVIPAHSDFAQVTHKCFNSGRWAMSSASPWSLAERILIPG